eukprot:Opistho-2@56124
MTTSACRQATTARASFGTSSAFCAIRSCLPRQCSSRCATTRMSARLSRAALTGRCVECCGLLSHTHTLTITSTMPLSLIFSVWYCVVPCDLYHQSYSLSSALFVQIGYWETFDGSLIRELEGSQSSSINGLAVAPDGNHYVTGGNDKLIKVGARAHALWLSLSQTRLPILFAVSR